MNIIEQKIIGQFDNCHWACRFQEQVSNLHKGKKVTLLYDGGNSTMIADTDEVKKEAKMPKKKGN